MTIFIVNLEQDASFYHDAPTMVAEAKIEYDCCLLKIEEVFCWKCILIGWSKILVEAWNCSNPMQSMKQRRAAGEEYANMNTK